MNEFEKMWRNKVAKNISKENNENMLKRFHNNQMEDPIFYSKELIHDMRESMTEERIQHLFTACACHMPKEKLQKAKETYDLTKSIELAHEVLLKKFIIDIKTYKQLSDEDLEMIISRGWGAAGVLQDGAIIATKIPSRFHEYFAEEDPIKKAFFYCHCPRVKKNLLQEKDLDSVYCYCGGGFYQNIWETITSKPVKITTLQNLFDGNEVCQFKIEVMEK
jgi:hypothetical protein